MKNYRLTILGLAISITFYLIVRFVEIDLFEFIVDYFHTLEEFELDEAVVPIMVFCFFAYFDQYNRRKSQEIELEKIKVYEAMLASSHHVLNNFLNQAMLIKLTAEETPGFSPQALALYDKAMEEASKQIQALGNIVTIDESAIRDSVEPK